MIKPIKNSILIIVILPFLIAFNFPQDKSKTIEIEALKTEPFKYYQFEAETTKGVIGEIYLNGKKLHEFKKLRSQITDNRAQTLIKNGNNEITLKILSIDDEVEKDYFSECVVFIAIHGVNEKIFPSKETQIVRIKWNPDKDQKKGVLKYVFELKR
ncbi:hypothetical protein ATE84_4238 [Aquimarina sp. MAR_2010_214]|uniref:hypothetical protein n=1 Tax=Aquimarina sp. MAR_2010_214 TaxID=1250026 RepID=UPI000C6FDE16|nr:hypothetical protein [Aquimarina sp. MAR_2010_214]PKV52136.1 hypothetical protein ATE84_4238 [Aquimarina sp. MAR_2010_214]